VILTNVSLFVLQRLSVHRSYRWLKQKPCTHSELM